MNSKDFCLVRKYKFREYLISNHDVKTIFSSSPISPGMFFSLGNAGDGYYLAERWNGKSVPWIAISDDSPRGDIFEKARYMTAIKGDVLQMIEVNKGNIIVESPFVKVISENNYILDRDRKKIESVVLDIDFIDFI